MVKLIEELKKAKKKWDDRFTLLEETLKSAKCASEGMERAFESMKTSFDKITELVDKMSADYEELKSELDRIKSHWFIRLLGL